MINIDDLSQDFTDLEEIQRFTEICENKQEIQRFMRISESIYQDLSRISERNIANNIQFD